MTAGWPRRRPKISPCQQAGGPLGDGAIEVAVPGGDRLAFVSLQDTAQIAVFNLQRALAHGFGPADYLDPSRPVWPRSGWPCPRTAGGSTRPAR